MPNSPLLHHTSDDKFLNDKVNNNNNNNNNTPLLSVTYTKLLNELQRNDDSPLSMHENVTANSPNHYRYNHHQTQQQHHRQGKPLYDHEIYSVSFPSSLILNNNYNNQHSSSSSLYNQHQKQQQQEEEEEEKKYQFNKMIIPTTALPPVLVKESISSQLHLGQEPIDQTNTDDFEIVRTKVTDITRTMQKYHVTELNESMIEDQLDIKSPLLSTNRPLSPLSILCPTTNSLIHTRVLEETGSYCDQDEDENDSLTWRNSFLDLMSTLITYSENLECISTELLRTEGTVRELVLLQKSMLEQYEEREKLYKDRLDECEQISQQQLNLIDHLIELDHDLDLTQVSKKKTHNRRSVMTNTTTTTNTTSSTIYRWQSSEHSQERSLIHRSSSIISRATTVESRCLRNDNHHQWDFSKKISDIIHINSMEDIVHTLRWEIGLWIGGGIGTGHVIHSFEGPLNGIELIIAGSGTIATPSSSILEESYIQSSSIPHLNFHRHHYMLHINHHDRKTRFSLLPKYLWTPDNQVDQCQFKTHHNTCSTIFSFFQRRHHCRRCGLIICQRHSLNRLPLFSSTSVNNEKWHRVCDTCFYDLIIILAKK